MDIRRILEIDRRFFREYQRQLLWVANTRPGRWYFRLGEFPKNAVFTRFFPFGIEWENADGTKTFAAKTSDKYANRLKHSLRYVKAIALALPANLLAPAESAAALQFLFAGVTTSFYPNADPESTTFDGYITRSGVTEAWAAIRGGAGNFGEDNSSDFIFASWLATTSSNTWDTIARGIFLFDTSAISTAATVSAVSFKFYCTGKVAPSDATASKRELEVVSSAPASNTAVSNADYASMGSTSFGAFVYADITASAVNTKALDAGGIANVTKGGISKFGVRSGADLDNNAPTWVSEDQYIIYGAFAETTGTANDPTLEVTYTAVLTFSETATVTDTVAKKPGQTRSETVTASENVSSLLVRVQNASDTITVTDSLGPKSISRTPVEIVTMTETVIKSFARSLVDIVTAGDSVTKTFNAVRSFLETVTLTDVVFFWRPRVKPTTNWTDRTPPSTSW